MTTLEIFALSLCALSVLLYATMHVAFASRMMRRRTNTSEALGSVSILKPLAGVDDGLLENLASFANLDHDDYEVLLGVASLTDAAVPIARRFLAENPHLRARIVVTHPDAARNPKVAQLIGLLANANGDIVVISDANVRVRRDYLRELTRTLALPNTGLVTSVISGRGERTWGAALENLQLTAHVAPGVVSLDTLTSATISIGKSMAMRRVDLVRIGGFESVANLLAEDHMLGVRFAKAGFAVRVSTSPVENYNVHNSIGRFIDRHARWAKMRRAISPFSFYLEPLLSPVIVATACFAVVPSPHSAAALMLAVVLQMLGAASCTFLLRRHTKALLIPLEIARSYFSLYSWLCAVVSLRLEWRGHPFVLGRNSELHAVRPSRLFLRLRRARTPF